MNEVKLERMGALAGVVFVGLVVTGALIGGSPPTPSDSSDVIVSYFRDNQDNLRVGSYLSGLALVPFLVFLGTVFGRLRRAEGGSGRVSGIALTGGVATVAVAMIANSAGAYAALHPAASPAFFRLSTIMFGYVGFGIAVFVAATSMVVLRHAYLEAWFGWVGAVLSVAWLAGAAAVSSANDTVNAIGFVTFLVWAVWIVALSILLYNEPEAPASQG